MDIVRTTPVPRTYRMPDLEAETGFSRHTIRKLIQMDVLPPALNGRGKNAFYTDAHLDRLKRIQKERESRRTRADYRELFNNPKPSRKARLAS